MSTPVQPTALVSVATVTLEQREGVVETLKRFKGFVQKSMTDGVHYGQIPGTPKKTLYKAGAEAITMLFGARAVFEYEVQTEEFGDKPFFYYRTKCKLVHVATGIVLAEGVGSANSHEKKYRYRPEYWDRKGKETPNEAEGWRYNSKKQYWYRNVEDTDVADKANTILKIAAKRAHVDAAVRLAAASEFFTQDIEDFSDEDLPRVATGAPQTDEERDRINKDLIATYSKKIERSTELKQLAQLGDEISKLAPDVKTTLRALYGKRKAVLKAEKDQTRVAEEEAKKEPEAKKAPPAPAPNPDAADAEREPD